MIYENPDPSVGFMMAPDFKWTGKQVVYPHQWTEGGRPGGYKTLTRTTEDLFETMSKKLVPRVNFEYF